MLYRYAGSSGWTPGVAGSFYSTSLLFPGGLAVGPDDVIYVVDGANQRVRRLDPDGRITTIGGSGPVGEGAAGSR